MNTTITINHTVPHEDDIVLLEHSQQQQLQHHVVVTDNSCCHNKNNCNQNSDNNNVVVVDTSAANVVDDLKICICLNNRGISLLEHGMYHEAVICFRTAIEGLQGICQYLADTATTTTPTSKPDSMSSNDDDPEQESDEVKQVQKPIYNMNLIIRMMLDGAIKLCSSSCVTCAASATCTSTCAIGGNSDRCTSSTGTSCGIDSCSMDSHSSSVCPSNDDDRYITIKKICCIHGFDQSLIQQITGRQQQQQHQDENHRQHVVYPISIDDFSFNEMFRDPRMTFAIVLYNIAAATKCQELQRLQNHRNQSDNTVITEIFQNQQQESLEQQIRLLTVADNILKKRLLQCSSCSSTTMNNNGTSTSSCKINVEKLWLVCSSGIVLATLLQAQSSYWNLQQIQKQKQQQQQCSKQVTSFAGRGGGDGDDHNEQVDLSMSSTSGNRTIINTKRKRHDCCNSNNNNDDFESTTGTRLPKRRTTGRSTNACTCTAGGTGSTTNMMTNSTTVATKSLIARLTLLYNFIVKYKQVCSCGGTEEHFPAAAA
jgi:hypothetical protein